MIYLIKDENGSILDYSLRINQIRERFPNTSFPEFITTPIEEMGIQSYEQVGKPQHNILTQKVVESTPTFDELNGVYVQNWQVVDLTPEEYAANFQTLINQHTVAVQNYMDDFARTRNYDNMQSAITYLNCGVPKFEAEAQYCSTMRAQIWATLYHYLAQVKAGTMQMEIDSSNVIALLPILTWPDEEQPSA